MIIIRLNQLILGLKLMLNKLKLANKVASSYKEKKRLNNIYKSKLF